MSNFRKLSDFFLNLQKMDFSKFDEATLKQTIILRIFSLLNWDIFNPGEVNPEYSVGGKRVDYALVSDGRAKVFIEVKKPKESLSSHQEQLLNYSFKEGIPLAVLTNGTTWWFYLPLQEASWEERKFDSIEMKRDDSEDASNKIRDYLLKEDVKSNISIENARRNFSDLRRRKVIDEAFPRAWDIIVSHHNNDFMELLNKTVEELSGFRISSENMHEYVRARTSSKPIARPITDVVKKPKITDSDGINYWMIPVRNTESIERLVAGENIWAYGNNTPGRKALQRGDWVCFYASRNGVVAHARVISPPEYMIHEKVQDPEKYPWIFKLESPEVYLENPVVFSKELRSKLSGFQGKKIDTNWGWFVQSNRRISKDDFDLMIRG